VSSCVSIWPYRHNLSWDYQGRPIGYSVAFTSPDVCTDGSQSQISRQRRFTTLFFRSSVSGAETSGTTPTRSDLLESKPVGSTAISEVNAIELQNLRAKKSDEQYEPHPRQECED
jgi:hypothetical protein